MERRLERITRALGEPEQLPPLIVMDDGDGVWHESWQAGGAVIDRAAVDPRRTVVVLRRLPDAPVPEAERQA